MPEPRRPARRLVANLGWEADLAGESPGRRVRATAAAFGTLMRGLALPGDSLHLEAPVAAERVPSLEWLPSPRLEHGALAGLPRGSQILAWAESSAVAAARRPVGARGEAGRAEPVGPGTGSLAERLWGAEVSSPEAASVVHHREFFFAVAGHLGTRLPGSALVSSLEELEGRLHDSPLVRGGAWSGAQGGAWVLKAPWSAAGRHRVLGRGGDLEPTTRSAVTRLLRRQSPLLLEPWVDRQLDFGVSVWVREDRVELLSAHRQQVDARGAFRGLELSPCGSLETWLPADRAMEVREVVSAVGRAAGAAGYRGPLGIDGFLYRQEDELRCQPLGEINARMTFGLLGRALAEALPEDLWHAHELCRLSLSAGRRLETGRLETGQPDADQGVDPRRRIHLLRPGAEAPGAAWIDFVPKKRPFMKLREAGSRLDH